MNAIPKREHQEVTTELTGIWKQEKQEDALLNLAAFKAKYQKRYPEAMRSLTEDEEHVLTFYAFPPIMHRYIRRTNSIESLFSNVRQRTDQIVARAHRNVLSDQLLGRHARYLLAKDPGRLEVKYTLLSVD